jgi:O-acetyl-ADP-ribose deacetylase (regulator of RNase III)
VIAETAKWGRAELHVRFEFETDNCPKCGARLARYCTRCDNPIYAPIAERCQFCGLPHPWAEERRVAMQRAPVRRWRPEKDVSDPATRIYWDDVAGDVWVVDADVTRLDVNAVMSNDDVDGRMWTEIARSIRVAAGPDVEHLARNRLPFHLGDAWVTGAGNMQADGIIHVAAMNRRGESTIDVIGDCLRKGLKLADEEQYESLAVAPIGSGPNAIDLDLWLDGFARVAVEHLSVYGRDERKVGLDEQEATATGAVAPAPRLSIVLAVLEPVDFAHIVRRLDRATTAAWDALGRPSHSRPERISDPPKPSWRRRLARLASVPGRGRPRRSVAAPSQRSEPPAVEAPGPGGPGVSDP